MVALMVELLVDMTAEWTGDLMVGETVSHSVVPRASSWVAWTVAKKVDQWAATKVCVKVDPMAGMKVDPLAEL